MWAVACEASAQLTPKAAESTAIARRAKKSLSPRENSHDRPAAKTANRRRRPPLGALAGLVRVHATALPLADRNVEIKGGLPRHGVALPFRIRTADQKLEVAARRLAILSSRIAPQRASRAPHCGGADRRRGAGRQGPFQPPRSFNEATTHGHDIGGATAGTHGPTAAANWARLRAGGRKPSRVSLETSSLASRIAAKKTVIDARGVEEEDAEEDAPQQLRLPDGPAPRRRPPTGDAPTEPPPPKLPLPCVVDGVPVPTTVERSLFQRNARAELAKQAPIGSSHRWPVTSWTKAGRNKRWSPARAGRCRWCLSVAAPSGGSGQEPRRQSNASLARNGRATPLCRTSSRVEVPALSRTAHRPQGERRAGRAGSGRAWAAEGIASGRHFASAGLSPRRGLAATPGAAAGLRGTRPVVFFRSASAPAATDRAGIRAVARSSDRAGAAAAFRSRSAAGRGGQREQARKQSETHGPP